MRVFGLIPPAPNNLNIGINNGIQLSIACLSLTLRQVNILKMGISYNPLMDLFHIKIIIYSESLKCNFERYL